MTRFEKAAGLEFVRSGPASPPDGATLAVLLHGRGSDMRDLQTLGPLLPADWVLLTPQAPFPGAPWGYGPGGAWYRYVAEDRVVVETLDESLEHLDAFYADLPGALGFAPSRLIMGGFSQGGTVSLAYALTRPGAVAAALNFSGFLVAHAPVDETAGAPPATPLFWGHGTADPSIPFALAERGRSRLQRAGAKLLARDYRMGHTIVPEEVRDAVEMVASVATPPTSD